MAVIFAALALLASQSVWAQSDTGPEDSEGLLTDKGGKSSFSYGDQGLQYESDDGGNFLWFGVRLQSRYSNSEITQDLLPGQPITSDSELKLNRGRLKVGGHLLSPEFAVYSEYDFVDNRLLDLRATYRFSDWLSVRAGQWKPEFNRERRDSSGAQQFVERSVSTPWFTIDRQKGVEVFGRMASGKAWDSSYWLARLSGAGRGGSLSDAEGMWMGRWQWNFHRRVLGFSQSDIGRRAKPAGSVAVAFVSAESSFTSFSSAGGGQLPGFDNGVSDRYKIEQLMLETAWQYRGFSWQQELHKKKVTDRVDGTTQRIVGGYMQAGMFFSEIWNAIPEPLELAVRFASVDTSDRLQSDVDREFSVGSNWFFNGHRNKISFDVSVLKRRLAPENDSATRYRLQWVCYLEST